jgi:hypothetical protein
MAMLFQKPAYFSKIARCSWGLVLALLWSSSCLAGQDPAKLSSSAEAIGPERDPQLAPTALLPYTAEYRANNNGLSATAQRQLSRVTDQHWQLSQQAKVLFVKVNEQSLMRETDKGLQALRYDYENSVSSRQNQHIVFDWEAGTVADQKSKNTWTKPLLPEYTDQLSAQLQMREALLNGSFDQRLTQTIVTKKGKLKTYTLEILDEEVIDTPVGKLNTIKLRRQREGRDGEMLVWLAKDWNYLIVRLEDQEDNDTFLLELLNARVDGKVVGPTTY